MEDSAAVIKDTQTLLDLRYNIEYTAETIQKLLEVVDHYYQGVLEEMKRHVEIIKKKVEDAQRMLEHAESALSRCESSQEYDEESGEYVPSCNYERHAVERARAVIREWEDRLKRAEEVLSDTERETDKYYKEWEILSPAGGDGLLTYQAGERTTKILEILDAIIDIVEEYVEEPIREQYEAASTDSEYEEEVYRQQQAIASEAQHYKQPIANAMVRCKECGRPIAMCVCRHVRET